MKDKEITKSKTEEETTPAKEEKKKVGRPTILTPELRARLIKLFEKHFFIAVVAARSDIYRQQIFEWIREQKGFQTAVLHAKDKWIEQQLILLRNYAKDKREKDWRALKYLLSIADVEYNDKKYLREATGKRDSTSITIIIDRRELETSKEEAYKVIGETKPKGETISLIPFEEEKKGKGEKKRQKAKPGEAET